MTATAPLYVLAHGWGFDAAVWDAVRGSLPAADTVVWDLGFFGSVVPPNLPADRPLVAVGHSYGTMALLRLSPPGGWAGFVAVNGFPRFSETDGYRPAVPARLVGRMLTRFQSDPAGVLADFRRRCGTDVPAPTGAEVDRLAAGLADLRDGDERAAAAALTVPVLLLAGDADVIAPPDMTVVAAACFRHAETEWLPHGGHLLPLVAPDWCVGHLRAFACKLTGEKV